MNKKAIILALTTLALVVSLFSIYSCNKNPDPGQCGYGPTVLKAEVQKEIVFPNAIKTKINFLGLDDYKERPNACIYAWAELSMSPAEMMKLLNGFTITDINNKENLLGIVAYYNSAIEPYDLKTENVYGFLVLTHNGKGFMQTQVFQRRGESFEHLKQFDAEIWSLAISETNSIAAILNGRLTNLGYAVRFSNKETDYQQAKKGSETNSFNHQIEKELKGLSTLEMSVSLKSKFTDVTHSGFETGCKPSECKVTGAGRCKDVFPSGAPECQPTNPESGQPGMCGGKVPYTIASVTNNNTMNQMVNFRDNILSHSDFGKHFIRDLEYVGYIFTNNLSISDAMDIIAVMDEVIVPLAEKLNATGASSNNTLFISSANASKLQDLITQMRGVSDDPLYQEILDEMSDNVTYVEGKTTASVHMDLLPS